MRIEFVHTDRDSWSWPETGTLTIGSRADNALILQGPSVAARHVCIRHDARGLVLEVLEGAAHVYVNARPVRERALLRMGDVLGIGGHGLRLCADIAQAPIGEIIPNCIEGAALRAVSGTHSGRTWSVREGLHLDASGRPTAESRAAVLSIEIDAGRLHLLARAPVQINGNGVREACLCDGDQLVLGTHRYVLDVPGCRISPARTKPTTAAPPHTQGARRQMGWLVLTAALLALLLLALLLGRP